MSDTTTLPGGNPYDVFLPATAPQRAPEEENHFAVSVRNRSASQAPRPALPIAPSPPPPDGEEENPFAASVRQHSDTESEPGLFTRFKTNSRHAFWTGTLLGSGLAAFYKRVADDPSAGEADRKKAQGLYDGVRNDLSRYELMRGYSGAMEGAVALAGQLSGGVLSPESIITSIPGLTLGTGIARRIGTAMVTQGAINAITDPAVQALSMQAGIQKDFSPARVAVAAGIGAVAGGVLQGAGEAIGAGVRKLASAGKPELPRLPTDAEVAAHLDAEAAAATATRLDLAQEDPALLAHGEVATPRREAARTMPAGEERAPRDVEEEGSVVQPAAPEANRRFELTPEQQEHFNRYSASSVARVKGAEARMFQENAIKEVQDALSGQGVPPADDLHLVTAARFLTEGKAVHPLDAYEMADTQIAAEREHFASIGLEPGRRADMLAGSERRGPGVLFRRKKAAGEPSGPGAPAAAEVAAGAGPPNEREILSLQDQVLKLADAIGHPVFQGRLRGGKDVIGQFSQGVARVRSITDIATAVHESAHYINDKAGQPLSDLIATHSAELEQLAAGGGGTSSKEGFAEFVSAYVTAPGWAARHAPEFVKPFESFMEKEQPSMFKALQDAQQASRDYLAAPTGVKLSAIVKTSRPDGAFAELKKIGLPQTVGNVMRWLNNSLLDRQSAFPQAVRALSRMVKDAGGPLPDLRGSTNPEILARQINMAHYAADAGFRDGVYPYKSTAPEGPGLRAAISFALGEPRWLAKWATGEINDFAEYTTALRGEYLWRKYENGDLPNQPLDISHAELVAEIAAKDAAHQQYRQAANMVHQYTRQLLRKQYESGHLPGGKETYERLLKEEFYVPFNRVMEDSPGDIGAPRLDARGQMQIMRQVGSYRDIINPLESLMAHAFLLEKKIARSEVIKAFENLGRLARAAGAVDTGKIIEEIPVNNVIGTKFDLRNNIKIAAAQANIAEDDSNILLGLVSDVFGEDPILGTMYHSEPTKPRGEPVVFDMVGGELRAYRFSSGKQGIALYEAISELSTAMRDKYQDIAIAIGQGVSQVLRGGVTTNPAYAVFNFLRDQPAAWILTRGFIPFYHGIRGIVSDIRQTDMAKLYAYSGGISPGAAAFQVDDVIKKDLAALARKGWAVQRLGALKDLKEGNIKGVWHAWAETIGVAETGTRIAIFENAFKRARKHGLSEYDSMLEAAFTAKDFLDFGRHGSRTESMRLMVTFINAWAQGSSKAVRTLFQPLLRTPLTTAEKEGQKYAAIAWGKMAFTGLAGYAYYKLVEDNESVRDALPETRAANVIVPGELFGHPGKVGHWPKPWELGIGWNIGEMIAQAEQGDERANDYFWRGVWEVTAPPVLVPNVFKLPLELSLNKSYFTGREIAPADVTQKVTAEAKASAMAAQVAKVTGWSPLKVDYAIGAAFGSWGRDVLSLSNATDPNKPEAALDEAVFLRRGIKKAFGGANEMIRHWWDMAGARTGTYAEAKSQFDALVAAATLNPVTHMRDGTKALEFIASLPDNQRAYVTLQSSAGDTGKAEYGPDQRLLHPLVRAIDAVNAINHYQTELNRNLQVQFATGKRVEMDPGKRRQVIDALDNLKRVEIRNALVMLKEPGFTDRKIMPVADQWQALRDIDPKAANEIATRYATNKVMQETAVARMWPDVRRRVLQGDAAGVKGLAAEAKAGGYEFGAARVKKPSKPLIKVRPSPDAQPMTLQ